MSIYDRSLGVCRSSYYVEGTLVIQPDGIGGTGGESGLGDEGLQNGCSAGFLHRPLDAKKNGEDVDPAGACALDMNWEGGILYCRPIHDPRQIEKLPELAPGESVAYGGSESVVSVSWITKDGKVKLGRHDATVPAVRAPELLELITQTETLLESMAAATMPPTTAAVAAWKAAIAPLKQSLQAQLVEIT